MYSPTQYCSKHCIRLLLLVSNQQTAMHMLYNNMLYFRTQQSNRNTCFQLNKLRKHLLKIIKFVVMYYVYIFLTKLPDIVPHFTQ